MKKAKGIIVGILLFVLVIAYLYMFFLPGIWHGNAFLYKKNAETYTGADFRHNYVLRRSITDESIDIIFTVDEKKVEYQILQNVEIRGRAFAIVIYKNGRQVVANTPVYDGQYYMLTDSSGNLYEVNSSGVILITGEGFPTYTQIVNWSLQESTVLRGNLQIFYVLIAAVVLLCLSYLLPRLLQASPHSGFANRAKRLRPILWGVTVILAVLSFIIH